MNRRNSPDGDYQLPVKFENGFPFTFVHGTPVLEAGAHTVLKISNT